MAQTESKISVPNESHAIFGLLRPSTIASVICDLSNCEDHDTDDLIEKAMEVLASMIGMRKAIQMVTFTE